MQRTNPGRRAASRAAAAAAASRADQIARIYTEHADELRAYVASITRTDPQTIEDACSHAWTQLLSHPATFTSAVRRSLMSRSIMTLARMFLEARRVASVPWWAPRAR